MNMLRSKTELLVLFLVVQLGNWSYGFVSDVVESQVKSWKVERRSSSIDFFTVYMKPTFRCLFEWCQHRFNATYDSNAGNYSYCSCTCREHDFASFLPSMRSCINARMAKGFAGCQKYFNRGALLDKPVDLTNQNSSNDLRVQSDRTCNLIASYFHDYDGFQSNWRRVADGVFALVKKRAKLFEVEWKPDTHQMLSGRIIRLNVTCGASSGCFLLKRWDQ
ncbi:PREDICTED: uncharacterized protein LOC107341426 [Acropora digitifera]|uniref:uncharacterized protein LOC107341426 n=1 Tax=Acropora digitifera TaxID=70779 RepID=UPI00077AA75B|nr:PREDICTED: uncharacterized protein LOC107341426 [Acropora digitifera]